MRVGPITGVTITAAGSGRTQSAISDPQGVFVFSDVPSGPVTVTGQLQASDQPGDPSCSTSGRVRRPDAERQCSTGNGDRHLGSTFYQHAIVGDWRDESTERAEDGANRWRTAGAMPSANVQSLQRRAAGVLPIRIEVPRAGTSHRFVKPLVIDEETVVSFRYRRR